MTDQEIATLKLELKLGRILGRSCVGRLKPLPEPDQRIARQDGDVILGGGRIRRYFDGAIINVSGQPSDLERKLQRMPDDGHSTTYDEAGNVLSRIRYR